MQKIDANDALKPLLLAVSDLTRFRSRPLLVLYYPPLSSMRQWDVGLLYAALRQGGLTKESPAPNIDLLIHTYGGDPTSAFGLAQTARLFAKALTVIVGEHAFSAGTLLTFGGDSIRMGDCAALSPIDITLGPPDRPELGIELVTLDAFMDFATDIRKRTERMLEDHPTKTSSVEADVLVQMVKEIGALSIGKFYRERKLTEDYATHLLRRGIFKRTPGDAEETIKHFLFGAPAHGFFMDSSMCRERGLPVIDMSTDESDKTKAVIAALDDLTRRNIIGPYYQSHKLRMPFIQYFNVSARTTKGTTSGKAANNEPSSKRRRSAKNAAKTTAKAIARNGTRRGPIHA